jgi:hypothetical protein
MKCDRELVTDSQRFARFVEWLNGMDELRPGWVGCKVEEQGPHLGDWCIDDGLHIYRAAWIMRFGRHFFLMLDEVKWSGLSMLSAFDRKPYLFYNLT